MNLLREGKTAEDIIQAVSEAETALQEERDKAAVIDKKREAAIEAIGNYFTAVYGDKVDLDIIRQLENDFKKMEKYSTKAEKVRITKRDAVDLARLFDLFNV